MKKNKISNYLDGVARLPDLALALDSHPHAVKGVGLQAQQVDSRVLGGRIHAPARKISKPKLMHES